MNKFIALLIISISILSCSNGSQYNDPIPLHDSFKITSKLLKETRVINVWTPPNYKTSNDSLPVLYMPDGGVVNEDFPHIANTISKLVENKSIPPIILVGIANTDRRRDLSGFSKVKDDAQYCPLTDGAKDFRAFISDELILEIDKKYRTTSEKGIIGESLAGLFVIETLLLQPETFNFYIAMDPSLWWNDHYLVKNTEHYLEKFTEKRIKLWFAASDAEDISIHSKSFSEILKNKSPETLIWKFSNKPKEHHNTIFRATKEKALIWTLNKDEAK
ncbi:alpha/beta hydrolase [Winogradskyella wichelsiae]|uniref:alpha/beta hydrolase n=1 Tax=Winogradskyella wichelsiae TaxID=2697007 RepID=UPI0015CA34FE|nr:alpha/beta hydrolase-fold protein [Winogradskyella wichelsiae]